MSAAVQTYLTFMFWMAILSVVVNSVRLISDHPRVPRPVNTGTDVFGLIAAIVLLAWIAVIRFAT